MELKASHLNPVLSFLFLWTASGAVGSISSIASPEPDVVKPVEAGVTILYDNNRFDPHLETAWGFSCLVRGLEKTILFDTGGDAYTLLGNMKQLRVEPAEIDIAVLSHFHGDHTGGLGGFLEKNPRVTVVGKEHEASSGKNSGAITWNAAWGKGSDCLALNR